jgi:hypothetical protein
MTFVESCRGRCQALKDMGVPFASGRPITYHQAMGEPTPLLCHRCGCELSPGEGNFYVVRIEAWADPAPPNITSEDLAADISAEIDKLIEQMRGSSLSPPDDPPLRDLLQDLD